MIYVIDYEENGRTVLLDEVDLLTYAIAFYRAEWAIRMKYHELVIAGRKDVAFSSNYNEGTIYVMDENNILHRATVLYSC